MSKKIIHGKELISISDCTKQFMGGSNKQTSNEFIKFLVDIGLLTKECIKYRLRNHYVYAVTDVLSKHLEGHYYTEPRKMRGEIKNGTLFFDNFMARVLVRYFLDYQYELEDNNLNDNNKKILFSECKLKRIMLEVAMKYYVPNIDEE